MEGAAVGESCSNGGKYVRGGREREERRMIIVTSYSIGIHVLLLY
jgi:hypothetical protein